MQAHFPPFTSVNPGRIDALYYDGSKAPKTIVSKVEEPQKNSYAGAPPLPDENMKYQSPVETNILKEFILAMLTNPQTNPYDINRNMISARLYLDMLLKQS